MYSMLNKLEKQFVFGKISENWNFHVRENPNSGAVVFLRRKSEVLKIVTLYLQCIKFLKYLVSQF